MNSLLRMNIGEYLVSFGLASLAYGLLLFEQWELASKAGLDVNILPLVLIQESVMAALVLALGYAGTLKDAWRYVFVFAAIVFGSYAGLGVVTRFNASLELVVPLETKGIPISSYQGTFYLLALAAALSYLLAILLLRRSYGKLLAVRAKDLEV